ncbi:5-dehydro-2-deoxygluconokinase, partial [Bacillus subtilis]
SYMRNTGVVTTHMDVDQVGHKAGLSFTEILCPEECSVLMYRVDVADLCLEPSEVSEDYIENEKMLLVTGTAHAK